MGVKMSVNGLTVVHQGSEGKANADIPDFCKTPVGTSVLTLPYPNKAESKDLVGGSVTVLADGGNSIALLGSQLSKSTGDQSGVCGGVVSGGTCGKGTFFTFSPDVMIEGRPVVRKTDKLIMNDINTLCLSGIDQPDINPPDPQQFELQPFKVKLVDGDQVRSGISYRLMANNLQIEGTTDGNGMIEVKIPKTCKRVKITLETGEQLDVKIGEMPEGDAGIQARLSNLGLYDGKIDAKIGPLAERAIGIFQEKNNLKIDCDAGPKTKEKLE